jgi:hypothetical protein
MQSHVRPYPSSLACTASFFIYSTLVARLVNTASYQSAAWDIASLQNQVADKSLNLVLSSHLHGPTSTVTRLSEQKCQYAIRLGLIGLSLTLNPTGGNNAGRHVRSLVIVHNIHTWVVMESVNCNSYISPSYPLLTSHVEVRGKLTLIGSHLGLQMNTGLASACMIL